MNSIQRTMSNLQKTAPVRALIWITSILVCGYVVGRAVLTLDTYYLVFGIICIIAFLLFLRRIDIALFAYALLAPFILGGSPEMESERSSYSVSVLPSQAGIAVLTLLILVRWFLEGRDIRLPNLVKPLVAFLGVATLSVAATYLIWDPDISLSERKLTNQIAEVLLYSLCVVAFIVSVNSFDKREWIGKMIWPVTVAALYVTIFEILYPEESINISRAHFLVAISLTMIMARLLFGNLRSAAIASWILISLPLLWACYHSLTWISGWLSASIGMGIIICWRSYRVGIVLALAALFVLFVYPAVFHGVYDESREEGDLDRIDMWGDAIRMAVNTNPILGVGTGSYIAYSQKFGTVWYGDFTYGTAHSNYAQVIGEMGLAGVLVFFWLIIAGIKTAWRTVLRAPPDLKWFCAGTAAVFISFVVVSLVGDYLLPSRVNGGLTSLGTSVQVWVLLGAAVAASGLVNKKKEQESSGTEHRHS